MAIKLLPSLKCVAVGFLWGIYTSGFLQIYDYKQGNLLRWLMKKIIRSALFLSRGVACNELTTTFSGEEK